MENPFRNLWISILLTILVSCSSKKGQDQLHRKDIRSITSSIKMDTILKVPNVANRAKTRKRNFQNDTLEYISKQIESLDEIQELKEFYQNDIRENAFRVKIKQLHRDSLPYHVAISIYGYDQYEFWTDTEVSKLFIKNNYDSRIMEYSDWHKIHTNNQWRNSQQFFPVFDFGMFQAITFDLSTSNSNRIISQLLDEIDFEMEFPTVNELHLTASNDAIIPSYQTERINFWRAENLEKEILNEVEPFSIICERGVVTRTPIRVVFNRPECMSQLVLLVIEEIDSREFGQPLLALPKLKLRYTPGESEKLEMDIWQKDSLSNFEFVDQMKAKSAGEFESFYLLYKDDFKWNSDDTMDFPTRYIYSGDELIKSFSIDLFGVPCL